MAYYLFGQCENLNGGCPPLNPPNPPSTSSSPSTSSTYLPAQTLIQGEHVSTFLENPISPPINRNRGKCKAPFVPPPIIIPYTTFAHDSNEKYPPVEYLVNNSPKGYHMVVQQGYNSLGLGIHEQCNVPK